MPIDVQISAIVPLYNGAQFIGEALNSILTQSLQPIEVIVVDDGSTDDGPDVARRMVPERLLVLLCKPNGGQSSARNFGVAHSRGDLIALLDQDDVWYPNHLEELIKPFREPRFPELGWVYGNVDEIDEHGGMVHRETLHIVRSSHPKRDLQDCLSHDMFVLPSASLISRRAFDSVGAFDERLSGYEDDDLFLRMFRAGYDNIFIDKSLTKWRIYSTSASRTPRMAKSRATYMRKLLETYPDEPAVSRRYASQLIAPRFLRTIAYEHQQALTTRRSDLAAILINDLDFISHHLAPRKRAVVRGILPFLRVPRIARAIYAARPILQPFSRFIVS